MHIYQVTLLTLLFLSLALVKFDHRNINIYNSKAVFAMEL